MVGRRGRLGIGLGAVLAVAAAGSVAAGETDALGLIAAGVGDVAHRQRACLQAVDAGIHRCLGAGDHAALQIGVAADAQVEATIAGLDAALLGDAGEVAVDLVAAVTGACAEADPEGHAAAHRLVLAGVGAGVLQALDVEIAADVGQYRVGREHRAFQGGAALWAAPVSVWINPV